MSLLNTLKSKLSNRTYLQIIENFFALSFLNVLAVVLPLITLPYLIRVVGVEKYGTTVFVLTVIQYVVLISNYGFPFSATKSISQFSENNYRISKIFFSVLIIRIVFTIVFLIILSILVLSINVFNEEAILYLYSAGIVFGDIFVPIWFYQGMQKMKYLTIINLISKGLFTVLIFVFIKEKDDYPYIVLLNSIGNLLAGIISIYIIYKYFNIIYILPKRNDILIQIRDGWHIFVSTIGINFYRNANIFILGLLTTSLVVGYYAAAEKIVKAVQSIITPVSESLYPYMSKRFSRSNQQENIRVLIYIGKYYFIVLLIISLCLFIFSEFLVSTILGKDALLSLVNLQIMSFVILFGGLNYFFGIIGLVNLNYKKQFSFFVLISGLVSVVLCSIFANIYFDRAASFAMLIGEFTLLIMIMWFILKIKNLKL